MIARLSELIFVEAVRTHLDSMPPGHTGWLAGLRDPFVGRCLALLHGRVAEAWSLEALGREVACPRSALAERFVQLSGEPPLHYLARWRMRSPRGIGGLPESPVGRVAELVGYDSEPAFNRAFKRAFGRHPRLSGRVMNGAGGPPQRVAGVGQFAS